MAEHKVGILQGASVALGVLSVVLTPITGGGSLAALPLVLSLASTVTGAIAGGLDERPGAESRVAFALILGLLGGGIAGAFAEGGLAAFGYGTSLAVTTASWLIDATPSSSRLRVAPC